LLKMNVALTHDGRGTRNRPMAQQPIQLPEKFGRYHIAKMLGAGGMGVVYLAKDTKLGDLIALKVPRLDDEDDPQAIERFLREAKVALGIQHPNLCHVREVDSINGIHFLTMPYIQGAPLSKLVGPEKPWVAEKALALVAKMAGAMQVVHQRGIMHRDLKPQNIMVKEDGEPVIMDFGLARGFGSGATRLTATGAALGTPVYMSPEQIKGQKDIGPRTDVYSLGVILYELLTGKPPFSGNAATVLTHILYKQPIPPSERLPALGARYDRLCMKALAKNPDERYGSMAELAAAIVKMMPGGKPVAAVAGQAYPAAPRGEGPSSNKHPMQRPKSSSDLVPAPPGRTKTDVPAAIPTPRASEQLVLPPASEPRRSSDKMAAPVVDPRRSGQYAAPPVQVPPPRIPTNLPAPTLPASPKPRSWQQPTTKKPPAMWFWLLGGGAVAMLIVLFFILIFTTSR
jgi:serine/threonine protein kinase